ncbi:hypothetical protein [Bifidobacterium myosotis]|uniref:Uncharacterized protein n=1 Tax=Bifidobacterium myosotis TaxID=1630166 RepID=A0A5M9ZKQ5_9BIFI|nr:hypothetical protein [Bifidobacterium myosotis]KAA8828154.1 hypothetical protein EMO91_06855 [Bifidobacterium myosotis]
MDALTLTVADGPSDPAGIAGPVATVDATPAGPVSASFDVAVYGGAADVIRPLRAALASIAVPEGERVFYARYELRRAWPPPPGLPLLDIRLADDGDGSAVEWRFARWTDDADRLGALTALGLMIGDA